MSDLIMVTAGEDSLPPLTEGERAALKVHKVEYDVALELPPFRVIGTLPGVSKTCIGPLAPVADDAASDASPGGPLARAPDSIARVDERDVVEWK